MVGNEGGREGRSGGVDGNLKWGRWREGGGGGEMQVKMVKKDSR